MKKQIIKKLTDKLKFDSLSKVNIEKENSLFLDLALFSSFYLCSKYSEINLEETIKRSEQDVNNVLDTVSEILNNIRENGDEAVNSYTEKFDGAVLPILHLNGFKISNPTVFARMTEREIDFLVITDSKGNECFKFGGKRKQNIKHKDIAIDAIIDDEQKKELFSTANGLDTKIVKEILHSFGFENSSEITKKEFKNNKIALCTDLVQSYFLLCRTSS